MHIQHAFLRSIAALALFAASGCEQVLDEAELPFTEMLVIRGVVKNGDVIDSLYVGRTLPYEEQLTPYWDEEKQRVITPESAGGVKDAVVSITVDGVRYPLTHAGRGLYGNASLVGNSGSTYRLEVSWNGKHAEAVTTVPFEPAIDSVFVTSTEHIMNGSSRSLEITCNSYCRSAEQTTMLLTVIAFDSSRYFNGLDSINIVSGSSLGPTAVKRTRPLSGEADRIRLAATIFSSVPPSGMRSIRQWVQVRLTAYDEAYYRYYLTGIRGVEEGGFAADRGPVAWNVTGDGIGMFIGASSSVVRIFYR